MIKQILKFLPFLILLAVIPFILPGGRLGSYYLTLMILSLSYATAALGLTVLLGYSGQISLAQAAFFGIGAYIFSILAVTDAQSYWLAAHLIVPVAPVVLLVHKLYDHISGIIGHSGVEHGGGITYPPSPFNSVTHHDQHHRYFNCNYSPHFTIWDRLMGTLHKTHDEEVKANLRRRSTSEASAQR